MASLKLCMHTGAKKLIKRSRVESLSDFTFSALRKIAVDTFGELPATAEFGYEDEDNEMVTIANDTDLTECIEVMGVSASKTLRIEITVSEEQGIKPALLVDTVAAPMPAQSLESINFGCSPHDAPGSCAFCGDSTTDGGRFCSEDCSATAASFNSTFMSPSHDPTPKSSIQKTFSGASKAPGVQAAPQADKPMSLLSGSAGSFMPTMAALGSEPSSAYMTASGLRSVSSATPPPLDDFLGSGSTPVPFTSSSPSMEALCEPSLCVPWVSPEVGRDVVISTFEQFGAVRTVDLVPREDHFLCFVHFDRWRVEEPAVATMRARLLNPPSPDYKESVEYVHPVTGSQRWLFSRSRVPSRAPSKGPSPVPETSSMSNPYGLGVVGINVPIGGGRTTGSTRTPTVPPPPTSAAFVPAHEPSLCVPWVRQNVTRELLQDTFSPYGSVKQVDLVPKGDHFLCFIHFHSWKLDDPVACAVRARLLNPPVPDHKETIYYMHPTLGRQRWLFARSWMSPQSSTPVPMPAPTARVGMPPKSFSSLGGESAFSSSGRFSTGGLFGPSSFSSMSGALPDAFKPAAQKSFDEENVSPFGMPFTTGGRQSMYTQRTDSVMKTDWRGGMPY